MQIVAKHIENLLMTMILKKIGEKTKIPKDIFSILFTWLENQLNRFQFDIVIQKEDLWSLKFFYLNQHWNQDLIWILSLHGWRWLF
jgi:hypothetical protein